MDSRDAIVLAKIVQADWLEVTVRRVFLWSWNEAMLDIEEDTGGSVFV